MQILGKFYFKLADLLKKRGINQLKRANLFEENDDNRLILYQFPKQIFNLKALGTTLTFAVGAQPVKNFTMIERHYFKEKLIKSFEFTFPFCIPNSTNTWEFIYTIPEIDEELKNDIIANPWQTKSDSFYFANDKLIMHNKAEYDYSL